MKIGFQNDVAHVATNDGHNFTLLDALIYVRGTGETITVPAGTTTDGASTPRLLWRTVPPFGKYWLAAILHDYLYRNTDKPKAICDLIFKEAMLSLGVESELAEAIYQGVHLFGNAAFNEDRAILQKGVANA